jgi:hypothetical protein
MGTIVWSNVFNDGTQTNLGSKIQQNFVNAIDILNSGISIDNTEDSGTLEMKSLVLTSQILTPLISNHSEQEDMYINFGDGSYKRLSVVNSSGDTLFEVDNGGNIYIPLGVTSLYPIGTITYFNGAWSDNSTFPGWYKCDGNNGTPNLENYFIRGMSSSGDTGGYVDATLQAHYHTGTTTAESDSHYHLVTSGTMESKDTPSHTHTTYWRNSPLDATNSLTVGWGGGTNPQSYSTNSIVGDSHIHTVHGTLNSVGDSHSHSTIIATTGTGEDGVGDNIPAYYTLIPIMRVA